VTTVVVTGTGTEIGKTYVTAALARELRAQGVEVHARKPVQSFAPDDTHTDADVLAAATGEAPHAVCPPHRWLPTPMAPPMAAAALGLDPFTIADLATEIDTPGSGITLVEGAGGLRSPLANDGDTLALIELLRPQLVILVADADLGTINAVRLNVAALRTRPVVFLNRFDPANDLHRRNHEWLKENDGFAVATAITELARIEYG
jgi:dethiobiotin synthetase